MLQNISSSYFSNISEKLKCQIYPAYIQIICEIKFLPTNLNLLFETKNQCEHETLFSICAQQICCFYFNLITPIYLYTEEGDAAETRPTQVKKSLPTYSSSLPDSNGISNPLVKQYNKHQATFCTH